MTDFGAFVELAPGVDALLHVSQISKDHVEKPSDVLKIGQEVEAKIVEFNEEEKKISLSIKALEEPEDNDEFEISEIYEEENPDGIIDKLFHTAAEESKAAEPQEELEHKVDPDEFALYKKYL